MARWTEADWQTVKAAYLTAAAEGIASATITGHGVQTWNADQWEKLLTRIENDLATATAGESSRMGMRMVRTNVIRD